MAITDDTREEDERLRKELETVDLGKLKRAIKPLVQVAARNSKSSLGVARIKQK